MEVRIISKETIKPSSSAPHKNKTYNLCVLHQIAPPFYVPVILFYSPDPAAACNENPREKLSDHLKQSFSETLTHFYPFAGRMKDEYFVDCSDSGALYREARVFGDMSLVLQEPDMDKLEKLLPCNQYDIAPEISSQVILKAQVNYFDCGGIAISACIWHRMADASAVASFITSWAEIASNGTCSDIDGVVFDCSSLFPPQEVGSYSLNSLIKKDELDNTLCNRFVFDGSKIAKLREVAADGPWLDRPTRFQAVCALIWSAMAAIGEASVVGITLDVRKRMTPPLPKKSIGSISQMEFAEFSSDDIVLDYNHLAAKLRESTELVSNNYVRQVHANGGYLDFLKELIIELEKNPDAIRYLAFSSWCRFPFYEADFGWGKPTWVTNPLKMDRLVFLIDTKDGQGIEAWIGLPKEILAKFEQNPGICDYASFRPINAISGGAKKSSPRVEIKRSG